MPKVTQPISGRAWSQSQVCLGLKFTALNLPGVFPPQLSGVRPCYKQVKEKGDSKMHIFRIVFGSFPSGMVQSDPSLAFGIKVTI